MRLLLIDTWGEKYRAYWCSPRNARNVNEHGETIVESDTNKVVWGQVFSARSLSDSTTLKFPHQPPKGERAGTLVCIQRPQHEALPWNDNRDSPLLRHYCCATVAVPRLSIAVNSSTKPHWLSSQCCCEKKYNWTADRMVLLLYELRVSTYHERKFTCAGIFA